jgi:orotate phosphoribosyltransferase
MIDQLPTRRGHFVLESGHHGDMWIDLELLCLRPDRVRPFAKELATRLEKYGAEVVCGPLVEGAFLALMVAAELGLPFTYSEPLPEEKPTKLYPLRYRLPPALCAEVHGRRAVIVNDAINVGSAVRGTFVDLKRCQAEPVAIAALAVFTPWASRFAEQNGMGLEVLASLESEVWTPTACPLCIRGEPLTEPERAPTDTSSR